MRKKSRKNTINLNPVTTGLWSYPFCLIVVFELLLILGCGIAGKIPTEDNKATKTAEVDINSQPGKVTTTFPGNESSWVPIISAGVIIMIVFLISIFACCIHCPFCIVYKRNSSGHRVV